MNSGYQQPNKQMMRAILHANMAMLAVWFGVIRVTPGAGSAEAAEARSASANQSSLRRGNVERTQKVKRVVDPQDKDRGKVAGADWARKVGKMPDSGAPMPAAASTAPEEKALLNLSADATAHVDGLNPVEADRKPFVAEKLGEEG
ncbi:hypothetical protein FVE85_9232 [Porphyridium purpureum]|uniref:Uncharacterized protein n=1 Tax=Porphyridium purpureum TaxID=35688 RepID=A0A5J4YPR7_PORPP|nr:hypothetical protein FVE85_9232 [Porphyridium purpureum]|eukprot:POR9527..scf222_8